MLRFATSAVRAFAVGLGVTGSLELVLATVSRGTAAGLVTAAAAGIALELTLQRTTGSRLIRLVVLASAPVAAALLLGRLLVIRMDLAVVAAVTLSAGVTWAISSNQRRMAGALAASLSLVTVGGLVAGAGAWSVDEPADTDPRMLAGNGVVVSVDTHAFMIQQAAVILRHDGLKAAAGVLDAEDPTAPFALSPDGRASTKHESYLWRMQLGARDADRVLKKPEMPDHFFNWWTHSGKGLIAGTSAATWAEQQFALATKLWAAGDRPAAMYRLGAAAHLVGDACAPPHASPYVPNHRAYEEWVVSRQSEYAVSSGGIYRTDFRVTKGHGGDEWSSAHTRGWLDECAHRSAELLFDTAQPPPDSPTGATPYVNTMDNFKDAQRLTAGYLAFFFESVGVR